MNHRYRFNLLFVLTIAVVLLFVTPIRGQANPSPQFPPAPLSALQLDPEKLIATLNRRDVAGAVMQLEAGWKFQYDNYYQRSFQQDRLTADRIAQSLTRINGLTQKRSALVYAIVVPNHQLEVILLLPNGQLIHHREAAATPQVINDTASRFRQGVFERDRSTSEYLSAAQQLYQWIIAPLKPALEQNNIDQLIFCLGQGLRSVPMAALHDGNEFLIEKYSVSIIPAFNLVDRSPARLLGARVLAMGASQFQANSSLPAVPLELSAIARLWQGNVLLNEQFTLSKLLEQRSNYPFGIIHLATHANFTNGSVQTSFIEFWDQKLRLDRLEDLDLRRPVVQLLVLSACETVLGDRNAELGFAGLAVQSGAKAALASLWSVEDIGTAVMMIDFYSNLKTAPTKAEALRQTQLKMLRQEISLGSQSIQQAIRGLSIPSDVTEQASADLSHPYYWAGFTMIGNPW